MSETNACVWVRDEDGIWDGDCGAKWEFFADGPIENKWNFCPECGRPAKVGSGTPDAAWALGQSAQERSAMNLYRSLKGRTDDMSEKKEEPLRAAPIRESSEGLTHATTTEGRTFDVSDAQDYIQRRVEVAETEPRPNWKGYWNNWIAPFHACPRCGRSLNWQRREDALERPLIHAGCCGINFSALMEWESPVIGSAPEPASAENKK